MRRTLTTLTIFGLVSGGFFGLGPAAPAWATGVTTVWTLVQRTCTASEQPAGEACFDGAGHAQDYNSVTSGSADGKTNGEHNSYQYEMPAKIAVGQPNQAQLTADVDSVTDGGAHSRICLNVYGIFDIQEAGDPCATTAEAPNGQSATASQTLTLDPANGYDGQRITLTIGFEEPGGYVNYDYVASNPVTHVTFGLSVRNHHLAGSDSAAINLVSSGTFDVDGPLQQSMPATNERGTAEVIIKPLNKPRHTARLKLIRATYFPTRHEAFMVFKVTKSSLGCMPVGHRFGIHAEDDKYVSYDMCEFDDDLQATEGRVSVSVKTS